MYNKKGFSLIELAIVIVIISVLIAAISVGNSLYQESILRSVITDMKRHEAEYNSFKSRYNYPPGDFNQAQSLWGTDCADTISCNGDGASYVNVNFFSVLNETMRAWKHLELSGIMNYNIPQIPSNYRGNITLSDVPTSKVRNAGYFIGGKVFGTDVGSRDSPFMTVRLTTNAIFLGRESNFAGLTNGAITGLQAFNLDKKFDDARVNSSGNAVGATSGFMRVHRDVNSPANCASGTTYNVTATDTDSCVFGYQLDRD